jgi:hypothetical protein
MFTHADLEYMSKHWAPVDTSGFFGKATVLGGAAGDVVSGIRIIQTGFDFGGTLINSLNLFAHDMYRFMAAVPTAGQGVVKGVLRGDFDDVGRGLSDLKALPPVSMLLDGIKQMPGFG